MHPVLLSLDILPEIFTHFLPDSSSDARSQESLAALARTCKTFYEPAMDLLWADTGNRGINPLLGCVTRLQPLMYRVCGESINFCSRDLEPLSGHEACQFLRHASRVRSLRIRTDEHFHLLKILPIETCVFPRLLQLYWYLHRNSRLFRLFLSPTLCHCSLNHCVLRVAHSDLRSIVTCCPVLDNLSIWATVYTSDDLLLLSETVRSFKRLKHLLCPLLDLTAWRHLSNLPTLVTVMNLEGPYKVPLDLDDLTLASFLNLTTLCLHVNTAAGIIALIQHSEFPSLKGFKLYIGVLHRTEAEKLFRALSQCKACGTLEHIDIVSQRPADERPDSPVIRHFLCFKQLQTMRLSVHDAIYFDNGLVEAMSSWPHIRSLELIDPCGGLHTITFRGLFTALRSCPHLCNLRIYMDAVNIDIDPESESFQHTSLRTFHVGSSHVEDPRAVARIIFSMLPCVSEVAHRGSNLVWDEVNRQLKSFARSSSRDMSLR
ncbi:hypothetical protein K503DRAFT_330903 [Rhizopogon vinicolor AM-OR11-026]|uniref:F-box domain-containing protein n=1 Tax=Rhizopogon vinicolor AM-OR11-026 TaxID=1314800 RepID=A0A1B7MTX4_9AGAM|nr:hypothetical protein K503DRAFT_330903 [Rhizopogon vinicolor AM-OR11-026]